MNKLIVTLMVAGALAVPAMASAQGVGHGFGQRSQEWFSRMDANGDGVVSSEEIARFSEQRFAKADADKDGNVTADEFKAARMKRREERREQRMERRFSELDRNGDKTVTQEEFTASAAARAVLHASRRFKRMDADGDGAVSYDEMKAARRHFRGRRR